MTLQTKNFNLKLNCHAVSQSPIFAGRDLLIRMPVYCKNKKMLLALLSQLRIHYALATHILKDLKYKHAYVSVTTVNQLINMMSDLGCE